MNTAIEARNICKAFGNHVVLGNASFRVSKGEACAVIGESGAGKTTLLRIIAGLEKPDKGTVSFVQKPVLGIVFQDFNLWPHLSVMDNVVLAPITVNKVPKRVAEQHALKLLESVGLEGMNGKYPSQLSGGERQRVAIARALAMNPEIILFDEITSNLDRANAGEIKKILKRLRRKGYTMVIVSHDIEFINGIADRLFLLEGGKVFEKNRPRTINFWKKR